MTGSRLHGRNVLVTGGAGFLGSHLVETLVERGARVLVADDFSNGREENLESVRGRVEVRRVDLARDELDGLVAGCEIVFHLAGHANIRRSLAQPLTDFEENALATVRLLEALRRDAPAAFVLHASSAAVYGRGSPAAMGEDAPAAPVSPYGASKLAAEAYLSVARGVWGVESAVLRLFPAYGPRQRQQVLYDFLVKLSANPAELAIEGDGEQLRDFVHARDVVQAFLLVAERGVADGAGRTYNVSGGEPVRIRKLAQLAAAAMGLSPRLRFGSAPRPGDAPHWIADTSRIRALGYRPTVPLSEGIAETVRWFRGLSAR